MRISFELSPAWVTNVDQLKADILPLALQARLLADAKSHVIEAKEKKKRASPPPPTPWMLTRTPVLGHPG